MPAITITGADVIAALLARDLTVPIQAGLTAIAAEVQNAIAPYPSASRAKQEFKSDKQRRFVFAAIRDGRIPYRRSGDLGRAWKIVPLGPYRVQLVNTQRYAGLVHGGAAEQAKYHSGTWTSETAAVDEVEPRAAGIMEEAIKKGLGL